MAEDRRPETLAIPVLYEPPVKAERIELPEDEPITEFKPGSILTGSISGSDSECGGVAGAGHGGKRDPMPEYRKDEKYWERRRKNNEAAKRSREKRRINDMAMEGKIVELTAKNNALKMEMMELKKRFGILAEEAHSTIAAEQAQDQVTKTLPTVPIVPTLPVVPPVTARVDSVATIDGGDSSVATAAANVLQAQLLALSSMAFMQPGAAALAAAAAAAAVATPEGASLIAQSSPAAPSPKEESQDSPLDLSVRSARGIKRSSSGDADESEPSTSFCPGDSVLGLDFKMKEEVSSAEEGSSSNSLDANGQGIMMADGNIRYVERRRRNNEAVRRCRENKRQRNQMRVEMSTILEVENRTLRFELEKINSEVKELKEILVQKKQTGSSASPAGSNSGVADSGLSGSK